MNFSFCYVVKECSISQKKFCQYETYLKRKQIINYIINCSSQSSLSHYWLDKKWLPGDQMVNLKTNGQVTIQGCFETHLKLCKSLQVNVN